MMESGMRVDLRMQSTGRSRFRLISQATVPTLMILMTVVSCSRPVANMPEPSYRVALPALPFFSRSTDGENQQLAPRRVDEQSVHGAEQHRISSRPKVAKIHAPDAATAPASRRDLQRANTPPLLDREKEQLFEQFQEWRRRQKDIP
jgi:hypothetical protein